MTFRTPVLDEPRTLVGPIALHLVAASTAPHTDWHAKLADVAPDGTESIITEGALRASHRELDSAKSLPARPYHTHTDPQPIEPDRFYEYDIEIWPTAYELPAGHRLQLRLTSTDLPTHLPGTYFFDADRPLDTRVELHSPAINTVRLHESYLVLPASAAAAVTPTEGVAAGPSGSSGSSESSAFEGPPGVSDRSTPADQAGGQLARTGGTSPGLALAAGAVVLAVLLERLRRRFVVIDRG